LKTGSLVAACAWLFVTVVSILIIWVTQRVDFWNFLYILILAIGAFGVSMVIPSEYLSSMRPLRDVQAQLTAISSKMTEIDRKIDEIKKALEE
jgi:hypothetical protein